VTPANLLLLRAMSIRVPEAHEPVALSQMTEIRAIQRRIDKAEQYLARLEQVEGADEELRRLRRMLGR
jgi:hypothetical protein